VVDQSKQDISDCKGLRDVAMATKFWPKVSQKSQNGHNFSCVQHIDTEFGFEIWFLTSVTSPVIHPYRREKGGYHGNQFWD